MAKSIGGNRSGSCEGLELNFTQQANPNTIQMINKLDNEPEFKDDLNMLKKLATIKHKEVLRETLLELLRKGSYVCIYPARGSEVYDQYFAQQRPLNRFLNRVIFQNETLENIRVPVSKKVEESPDGKISFLSKQKKSRDVVNFKNIKD